MFHIFYHIYMSYQKSRNLHKKKAKPNSETAKACTGKRYSDVLSGPISANITIHVTVSHSITILIASFFFAASSILSVAMLKQKTAEKIPLTAKQATLNNQKDDKSTRSIIAATTSIPRLIPVH
ncbi:MAG TPA: hypothetical protein VF421_13000 [Niabella sp.]